MDSIGKHLEMLKLLDAEDKDRRKAPIIDKHSAIAQEGYRALEEDIIAVLDKHLPLLLERDRVFDEALAALEGDAPCNRSMLLAVLTLPTLSTKLDDVIATWVLSKLGDNDA